MLILLNPQHSYRGMGAQHLREYFSISLKKHCEINYLKTKRIITSGLHFIVRPRFFHAGQPEDDNHGKQKENPCRC